MSKYQALKDTLKALDAICKWSAEEHDIWEGGEPFDSLVGSAEDANVAAYIAAANPATISALLADLERAEKALKVSREALELYACGGSEYRKNATGAIAAIDAALSQIAGGGEG